MTRAPEPPAFEVLDALSGLCRLERRDGTLDGSVPLRVVQGCVPFLEGNAFGFQVVLGRELLLEKRLGGPRATAAPAHQRATESARKGALPRLAAQGFLGPPWLKALEQGLGWSEGGLGGRKLRLWTGLLVRPREGLWLRVSAGANRRNVRVNVDTYYIEDHRHFTPLVLDLTLLCDELWLQGEIATLAPVAPSATFEVQGLAQAPEVGQAHGDFYDQRYFATKKGEITKKYRKLVGRKEEAKPPEKALCRLIEAGPASHRVAPVGPFLGPASPQPSPRPRGPGELREVRFGNLVPFRASFDGHTMRIEHDNKTLPARAREVERCFAEAMGKGFQEEHRGALWYLTKYFTPHPPGEAHFFVKPWAFVCTPPGWSCLVDGEPGDGYDILRGVVATDRFHATPAVFWLHRIGTIEVGEHTPLMRVLPVPRSLLPATFRQATFRDGV